MKKQMLLFAACCFLAGIATIPAYAQTYVIKIKVPFNFIMGDKTYQAGEYVFSSMKDTIVLQNAGGTGIAMALANHVTGQSASKGGKVVFECYTNQCFLFETWTPGQDDGRQLLRSHTEMQVAAKQPGKYLALLGTSVPQ